MISQPAKEPFFPDIWTHLNGLQYYPCLCVRRTITTSWSLRLDLH